MATADEIAQWTKWLAEAQQAYHQLAIGQMARVFVDQNGERVEYSAGNKIMLSAYIAELQRLLGLQTVVGPLTPWF